MKRFSKTTLLALALLSSIGKGAEKEQIHATFKDQKTFLNNIHSSKILEAITDIQSQDKDKASKAASFLKQTNQFINNLSKLQQLGKFKTRLERLQDPLSKVNWEQVSLMMGAQNPSASLILYSKNTYLSGEKDREKSAHERKAIFDINQRCSKDGYSVDGIKFPASTQSPSNKVVTYNPLYQLPKEKFQPKIDVVNEDSINHALNLIKAGFNPLVMDMAHPSMVCGDAVNGRGNVQEEQIAYRSDLYFQLSPFKEGKIKNEYFIPHEGGIYIKNVIIMREDNKHGYAFMREPKKVDIYATAAYRHDNRLKNNPNRPVDSNIFPELKNFTVYRERTKNKIRSMFQAGIDNKNDSLVLGAFGTGAFENPVDFIIDLYKEVIEEYKECFKCIDFAILDPNGNTFHKFASTNFIKPINKYQNSEVNAYLKAFEQKIADPSVLLNQTINHANYWEYKNLLPEMLFYNLTQAISNVNGWETYLEETGNQSSKELDTLKISMERFLKEANEIINSQRIKSTAVKILFPSQQLSSSVAQPASKSPVLVNAPIVLKNSQPILVSSPVTIETDRKITSSTLQKEILTKDNLHKFKSFLGQGVYEKIYKAKISLKPVDSLAKLGGKYLIAQKEAHEKFETLLNEVNDQFLLPESRNTLSVKDRLIDQSQNYPGLPKLDPFITTKKPTSDKKEEKSKTVDEKITKTVSVSVNLENKVENILPIALLKENLTKDNLHKFKSILDKDMYEKIYMAKIRLKPVDSLAKLGGKYLIAQEKAYKEFEDILENARKELERKFIQN